MASAEIRALGRMLEDVVGEGTQRTVTKTGKLVDLSKGFTVKAPDGTKIPFRPGTDLEKAKQWTKNFYDNNYEFKDAAKTTKEDKPGAAWTQTEEYSMLRNKSDRFTYLQFADLEDEGYRIQMSFIPQSKRGQGIGAGMYRYLFERAKTEGKKVQSDSLMSNESIAIWQRFKQLGYPVTDHTDDGVNIVKDDGREMYKRRDGGPLFEFIPSKASDE